MAGRPSATLGDKSTELENVKSKLEEYKRLADTDPLTHIWNRRAFDRHIAGIYNSRKGVMFNALILADIDRFKEINDRYGHPVGDKIIQIIAEILQLEQPRRHVRGAHRRRGIRADRRRRQRRGDLRLRRPLARRHRRRRRSPTARPA